MTGDEWARSTDPWLMIEYLKSGRRVTDRKARLLACGLLRRFADWLADEALDAVKVAEQYADGRAGPDQLAAAAAEVWVGVQEDSERHWSEGPNRFGPVTRVLHRDVDLESLFDYGYEVIDRDATGGIDRWYHPEWNDQGRERDREELVRRVLAAREREGAFQAALVRELFGDPFRPSRLRPGAACLRTDAVRLLARWIDDRQDFSAMPILADALEEAGCDDQDLLDHCRHGRSHARGCWALDLVLGRE
ncbi:MAG TPA: hypothetical protein VKE74_05605 [Gemmataceae bacterium]|nr:hypothetical protein [Gemmataceae bacterium]